MIEIATNEYLPAARPGDAAISGRLPAPWLCLLLP